MPRLNKKVVFLTVLISFTAVFLTLYFKKPPQAVGVLEWNVSFSQKFASSLGLDWQKTYLSILDELKPRKIRLPVYWDVIEEEKNNFNFADYDFMMNESDKRGVQTILVVGKRTPRWPECHEPDWNKELNSADSRGKLLSAVTETVNRYKNKDNLSTWQVENEPFLPYFGECTKPDGKLLDEEIALVKSLDPKRPIMVTDSGELSFWVSAASRADIFGTTMYRTVWSRFLSPYVGYITYPLPPKFFWFKSNLTNLIIGENKPIVVSELQAEPWSFGSLPELSAEEQAKSMTIEKFRENINYAEKAGFPEVYLWGAEWWYFMKEKNGDNSFWNEARRIISAD